MKNSTLLFRSLAVILLLGGSAHLVSYASKQTVDNTASLVDESVELQTSKSKENTSLSKDTSDYNEETDYIIGNWKTIYNSKDFKGAIIYTIKKEKDVFNAYTHAYEDENGDSEKAKGDKILMIKSFDGYKGKGIYKVTYEKQTYDIECEIDMVDENTFKLSYEYYGYSDVETWKRQ